jgi:hypothetical protein
VVGTGLRLLSVAPPTVSRVSSSPWSTGSDDGISCDNSRLNYQHISALWKVPDYSTR